MLREEIKFYESRLGYLLAILYCLFAACIAADTYHCQNTTFVRCDLLVFLVTLPAAWVWYEIFGAREFDFIEPHAGDVIEVALLILVCAALVYIVGYGLECLCRAVFRGAHFQLK